MAILNIGSLNIDHVYRLNAFVRPGETLNSTDYQTFAGGKGFNQSVALARAGVSVRHVGCVGADGLWLVEKLRNEGVDTSYIETRQAPTGHAIIQVVPSGENAIFLFNGANHTLGLDQIQSALQSQQKGDYLLVQNETNATEEILRLADQLGLQIVFNPAPMSQRVLGYPLELVHVFILNETEAEALTGESIPDKALSVMRSRFPKAKTILTLGAQGALYCEGEQFFSQPPLPVSAIDTTGAGDTFTGFFLAKLSSGGSPLEALQLATAAAARCITHAGAADSIPFLADLSAD